MSHFPLTEQRLLDSLLCFFESSLRAHCSLCIQELLQIESRIKLGGLSENNHSCSFIFSLLHFFVTNHHSGCLTYKPTIIFCLLKKTSVTTTTGPLESRKNSHFLKWFYSLLVFTSFFS